MPGIRDRNLRSGNIHEELGVLLLRPVALVAQVPIWEDVGLDAVATLVRPEGGRRMIPEDTFGVQLKASSERVVSYETHDAARWLMNLGLPFFIGSVRIKDAAIDLYPTPNLFKVRLHDGLREVHLHLDGCAEQLGSAEIAHVSLGPPALPWCVGDLADANFPARAYPVLKGHIRAAQENINGRPMGHIECVKWQMGQPPTEPDAYMLHTGGLRQEFSEALASLQIPIRTLLTEMNHPRHLMHLPAVFEFVKVMRALGSDPDPGDCRVKTALGAGRACELRRKVFARLLALGMSPVRIWCQGALLEPLDSATDTDTNDSSTP